MPGGDSILAVQHLLQAVALVCLECRAWKVRAWREREKED